MVYQWKEKAVIRKGNVQRIGEELETFDESERTPETIVAFAQRNKRSELHKCFEWNDTRAAAKWRLEEARNLIQSIEVVIEHVEGPHSVPVSVNIRAFESVKSDTGTRSYVSHSTTSRVESMKDQIKSRLVSEIDQVLETAKRYCAYDPSFLAVFDQVEANLGEFRNLVAAERRAARRTSRRNVS